MVLAFFPITISFDHGPSDSNVTTTVKQMDHSDDVYFHVMTVLHEDAVQPCLMPLPLDSCDRRMLPTRVDTLEVIWIGK